MNGDFIKIYTKAMSKFWMELSMVHLLTRELCHSQHRLLSGSYLSIAIGIQWSQQYPTRTAEMHIFNGFNTDQSASTAS